MGVPVENGQVSSLALQGQLWSQTGDTASGWALVRALRSSNSKARIEASALLAKAPDCRLPEKALTFLRLRSRGEGHQSNNEVEMNTPYGLEIIDSCVGCKLHKEHSFCNLSPALLGAFSNSSHPSTYPGGAILFVEGQMPRGAFVLCSGRVKLSTTSRDGKVLILKIAEAGDMLGLSAVISGTAYEVTAETSSPCHVNFIEKDTPVELIAKNGEMGLQAAETLSREFQSAYRDIHDLVLARSSAGKLARLLLSWTQGCEKAEREIRIRSSLTHEEMAQMIGSSRETVTRLLSDLKKKELIRQEGSTLVIRNKPALEALAI